MKKEKYARKEKMWSIVSKCAKISVVVTAVMIWGTIGASDMNRISFGTLIFQIAFIVAIGINFAFVALYSDNKKSEYEDRKKREQKKEMEAKEMSNVFK